MKDWEKPRLIVLVRSKPEELVLDSCKAEGVGEAGPSETVTGCHAPT
jgi:hypothetical protein